MNNINEAQDTAPIVPGEILMELQEGAISISDVGRLPVRTHVGVSLSPWGVDSIFTIMYLKFSEDLTFDQAILAHASSGECLEMYASYVSDGLYTAMRNANVKEELLPRSYKMELGRLAIMLNSIIMTLSDVTVMVDNIRLTVADSMAAKGAQMYNPTTYLEDCKDDETGDVNDGDVRAHLAYADRIYARAKDLERGTLNKADRKVLQLEAPKNTKGIGVTPRSLADAESMAQIGNGGM